MKRRIIAATGNTGKIKEIKQLLCDKDIDVLGLEELFGYKPEIEETGRSFLENAGIKAEWVLSREDGYVIADDSGLEVDSLNGAPGIYSSRYAGDECDDWKNIEKLLNALRGKKERAARFKCVVVLRGNGIDESFQGECEGTISEHPSGSGGFGYDPVFIPNGFTKSFAEIDSCTKNSISHRGKAMMKLRRRLYDL